MMPLVSYDDEDPHNPFDASYPSSLVMLLEYLNQETLQCLVCLSVTLMSVITKSSESRIQYMGWHKHT